MIRGRLIAIGALVLFAGCASTAEPHGLLGRLWRAEVGPSYQRPAVDMPGDFRGHMEAAEAASFADLPWWGVFDDPTLRQLVRDALAGSYDLQEAVARIEQARALVGVAASQFYPQVGYQGAAVRQRIPGGIISSSIPEATFNVFLGVFDVAWEIDLWGRIRRTTEVARAQFLAGEEARRGIVVGLVGDVAAGYFHLLALDRQMAVARESADTYRRTRDMFTQRYVGGTDTKISSARAEADLQDSIAAIAELQRQITQQENAIHVLLGSNPGPIDRGMSLVEQTMPSTPPGLTTDLLRRRPDIRRAEQTMISANSAIGVAVANFFPVVGLSALYGGASSKIGNVVKDSASLWNIAANVAGPVFQGGRLLESYRAQQAFWDQTVAEYRATIVEAFREVADALAAEARLREQRTAKEAQVVALRQAVDLSLARYETGRSNYIEVLDAEEMLYPAERSLAQTQRDQLVAVVSLYKALGGGWETAEEPAGEPIAQR
jgi:multidrug efflux system outer membrane protein